ncbi:hypothetical protein K1I99_00660 [Streptococcus gordonii]|jgi:hypothetical protein|uniref:DUF6773 family protein n=1 Tax=Streptococcus gordonii TaxID=1302 RepID=UPI001CBD5621|nr:DUF6773 family protein [Streptococcus gordonii]MBZ2130597.1 hypothetical protein [Streptococcus gordonii]MCY7129834.1 hypothetical protein [Streptococcus gordonii]MCY7140488.1 hypothetical protein [Streptococcus gordonii]
MKSKDRQEIFKDERTIQIEHKLGNEIAFFAIILLLLSIFVKLVFLRLDLQAYLPEIVIIFTLEIYADVRSWQLGLDINPSGSASSMKKFRSSLVIGSFLATSFLLIQILGGNSKLRLFFSQHPVMQFAFVVIVIALLSGFLDKLVNYFNRKRQIKLEQELENDEN